VQLNVNPFVAQDTMTWLHNRPRIAVLTCAAALIVSCSSDTTSPPDDDPPPNTPTPVASITITPSSVTVTVGLNQTLTATTLSSTGAVLTGRTVTWTTSNGNIATVTGGVVTGIAPGSATITASSEGRSQTAAATVSAPPPAQASFASITPGGNHTCALNAAGKAFCWGSNQFGQIGIATPGGLYMTPQAVTGNTCGYVLLGDLTWCGGSRKNA
jgi:hypothetical protein